eukprot:TRINITY_DN23302_c0_g1_i1.p1 TRINITY_DN23302_c0_g1~~TRINITY_DN23302_c0_g1_i1.p1  ORF type:complete len:312 (+),score=46.13 TRINITY_DN23302_c0_g1_i1:87-938(+)
MAVHGEGGELVPGVMHGELRAQRCEIDTLVAAVHRLELKVKYLLRGAAGAEGLRGRGPAPRPAPAPPPAPARHVSAGVPDAQPPPDAVSAPPSALRGSPPPPQGHIAPLQRPQRDMQASGTPQPLKRAANSVNVSQAGRPTRSRSAAARTGPVPPPQPRALQGSAAQPAPPRARRSGSAPASSSSSRARLSADATWGRAGGDAARSAGPQCWAAALAARPLPPRVVATPVAGAEPRSRRGSSRPRSRQQPVREAAQLPAGMQCGAPHRREGLQPRRTGGAAGK